MQLIETVEAVQPTAEFPPVRVGDRTISEEAIAAELQFHPAERLDEAWQSAARSLVVRELLLGEAQRLAIGEELPEEERIAATLESLLDVPTPDEQACRRFFEANPRQFRSPTLLAVSHILLAAAPDDAAARIEQKEVGERLLETLRSHPAHFAELARRYSACESRHQGGSLGQIGRGQTVEEFERSLWSLPEGLHDRLVESRYGWHLVRVDRRMEGRALAYEAVRDHIRHYLQEQVTRRALRQHLRVLASEAGVTGVDLDLPDSPLLQ